MHLTLPERERLEAELEEYEKYAAANANRKGLPRLTTCASRHVDAVRMAIKRAMKTINDQAPDLWTHLKPAIKTGRDCAYLPGTQVWTWDVG